MGQPKRLHTSVKTHLDIIHELSLPYSLARQRLSYYLMVKRLELELLQEYSKWVAATRKLRRTRKHLRLLKKKKRQQMLHRRLILAMEQMRRERHFLISTLKTVQSFESRLITEHNIYPIFPIERSNSLFRLLSQRDEPQQSAQMNFFYRLMRCTVSELAFVESQIQRLSMMEGASAESKFNQLAESFAIGLKLTHEDAQRCVEQAAHYYGAASVYATQSSWDCIRRVATHIKSIRLQLFNRHSKSCVTFNELYDISAIVKREQACVSEVTEKAGGISH